MKRIRNFSIIAHIDHGKSTLADRMIEYSGVVDARSFKNQILDNMDIERERGITIKSQAITLPYRSRDGKDYTLNLIDTPGHVDFSYEVSRSLASCEGVLLLIDAVQGVQAQTVANLYMAMEHDLEIIPVINKIDLPAADVERAMEQIDSELGLDSFASLPCSAKEGTGVEEILEAIVQRVPPPKGDTEAELAATIFDAQYDPFRGTVIHCRIFDGTVRSGDIIRFMHSGSTHKVAAVGHFLLPRQKIDTLSAGDVGYIIAGLKTVSDVPSFIYQKDSSVALGQGFRCGFLGLLHLEIVQERLEREYDLSVILSVPSVRYRFTLSDGTVPFIDNPAHYPDAASIVKSEEPYIRASMMFPERHMGAVMKLCKEKRGDNSSLSYPSPGRIELVIEMPLADVICDFYDRLKSVTQGYGSFDYDILDYRESNLVLLDILVNGERVDALSQIVFRGSARERGLRACERLKEEIPRQMFKTAIQGAIGGEIISRTTISPFRKDVIAKCYGGDITRKRKLLEKQKKGKKRMKMVGSVAIPQSAFVAILKSDNT